MPADPYVWDIALRDGSHLERGMRHKGEVILNPCQIPAGDVARIAYIPTIAGWKPVAHFIPEGAGVAYAKVREILLHGGRGDVYAAARSEVRFPDGRIEAVWMFPNGDTVWHSGTYEELLAARKAAT